MKYKTISFLFLVLSPVVASKSISIVTNEWAPYINSQDQKLGTAAELLRQILSQEDNVIAWQYQNYDLAFDLVSKGKQPLGFPYFKTEQRNKQVYYSAPVFRVKNRLYFNRQNAKGFDTNEVHLYRFGKVAGYSYGQRIDELVVNGQTFVSEKEALESLFKNEIDFLPMTESVMNHMLNNKYQEQALLIKHVDDIEEYDSLHVIAPKNEQGAKQIELINNLLNEVRYIESLKLGTVERFVPKDIAKLITAEGYPVIVGQTSLEANAQFFTLPQGTKVLVLSWSDKILKPSSTDRIYKSMMDLSHAVVLNGPHVGKELYIKNMYIEIQ